jgi:hypothetical protein
MCLHPATFLSFLLLIDVKKREKTLGFLLECLYLIYRNFKKLIINVMNNTKILHFCKKII